MSWRTENVLHIMAIDCCEHTTTALESATASRLTAIQSQDDASIAGGYREVNLIVIGVPKYPIRRLFISQIRRIYSGVPMLLLRRFKDRNNTVIHIGGEFVLSSVDYSDDLDVVRAIRHVLPLRPCDHTVEASNYETIRDVIRVICQNYAAADLNLESVASELPMSSTQLSRILNQTVGSFRHLLRQTRIEEAKRMLASQQYSVKEVAARVGFSDSHYFSRTFKELTGMSASEYRSQDAISG